MPFSLMNAPATIQTLLQKVLENLNPDEGPDIVVNDVLVFSCTMKDHVKHLRQVLEQLRNARLKLKPTLCHFIGRAVEYSGHVITPEGLEPNPKQLFTIQDHPAPESVSQVHRFLRMTCYYRRFIEGFAKTASPLYSLTKKTSTFIWTTECQKSFESLKEKLTWAPVLVYPDFGKSFVLNRCEHQSCSVAEAE